MNAYLDTVIVIYAIEGDANFRSRAHARLAIAGSDGDTATTSDLTRLECLIKPLRTKNARLGTEYLQFLGKTDVVSLTAAVIDKAAEIRAQFGFSLADSIHLAAAVGAGCDSFLTNDTRLSRFQEIVVEILP
jgi:predicted nucleic acid-binding protein